MRNTNKLDIPKWMKIAYPTIVVLLVVFIIGIFSSTEIDYYSGKYFSDSKTIHLSLLDWFDCKKKTEIPANSIHLFKDFTCYHAADLHTKWRCFYEKKSILTWTCSELLWFDKLWVVDVVQGFSSQETKIRKLLDNLYNSDKDYYKDLYQLLH